MKIIISILIILSMLSISVVSQANFELTEEKMIKALNEVCGYKKTLEIENEDGLKSSTTIDFENVSYTIDTDKDIITLNVEESGKIIITYNLDNPKTPIFTYNGKFTKEMTEEEFFKETANSLWPERILFCMVAKTEGILPEDSAASQSEELFNKYFMKIINIQSNFSDAITSAKLMYDEEINTSNEFVEVVYEKVSETDNEYNIKTTFKVKENADFSKLEGAALKQLKEGTDNEKLEDLENGLSNFISNTISGMQGNEVGQSNTVANFSEIPKTGNEISLEKVLTTIIIMAVIMMSLLSIYNRKRNS